jgi:hypothetical protein
VSLQVVTVVSPHDFVTVVSPHDFVTVVSPQDVTVVSPHDFVTVVSPQDRTYIMLTIEKISVVTHLNLKALNVKDSVCYSLR